MRLVFLLNRGPQNSNYESWGELALYIDALPNDLMASLALNDNQVTQWENKGGFHLQQSIWN